MERERVEPVVLRLVLGVCDRCGGTGEDDLGEGACWSCAGTREHAEWKVSPWGSGEPDREAEFYEDREEAYRAVEEWRERHAEDVRGVSRQPVCPDDCDEVAGEMFGCPAVLFIRRADGHCRGYRR